VRDELPFLRQENERLGSLLDNRDDTCRDRKACIEAKKVAVAGHPSDGESLKISKTTLEGLVSLVIRKGYFRLSVASI
jgi:hypothetical protein